MNCKHCGAPLSEDSKFCSKCGKTVEVSPAFCSNCGAELEADARFCRACGTATGKTDSAPANTGNAPQASASGDGIALSVKASREVDRWFGGKFSRQAEGTSISGDEAAKLSLMQILLSVCSVFTFLFYLFPAIKVQYMGSWSVAFFGAEYADRLNEDGFGVMWTFGSLILQIAPLVLAIVCTILPLVKGTVLKNTTIGTLGTVFTFIAAISSVVALVTDISYLIVDFDGWGIDVYPNFWGFMLTFAAAGMIVLTALIQSKKKKLGLQ